MPRTAKQRSKPLADRGKSAEVIEGKGVELRGGTKERAPCKRDTGFNIPTGSGQAPNAEDTALTERGEIGDGAEGRNGGEL